MIGIVTVSRWCGRDALCATSLSVHSVIDGVKGGCARNIGAGVSSRNGRCNSNERGSARNRRERKLFLLATHGRCAWWPPTLRTATIDSTVWVAQCWECSTLVTFETMIVDRIKPGEEGGTYRRNNIRIHCPWCSGRQGQTRTMVLRARTRTCRYCKRVGSTATFVQVGKRWRCKGAVMCQRRVRAKHADLR